MISTLPLPLAWGAEITRSLTPSLLTSATSMVSPKPWPQPALASARISRPPLLLGLLASSRSGRLGRSASKRLLARALSQVEGAWAAVLLGTPLADWPVY